MPRLKEMRGITLIALVVTIIVVLLLAGIAVSMLSGENGILNKAVTAKKNTEDAEENEIVRMNIMGAMTKNKGRLTKEGLQEEFNEMEAEVYKVGDGFVIKLKSNKMYTVDSNGRLKDEIEIYTVATNDFLTQISDSTYGTEAKPYEIGSIEDLVELSYKVNGTVVEDGTLAYTGSRNRFDNKHIKLTNNLNFSLELSYKNPNTTKYGDINENGEVEGLLTELTTGTGWKSIGIKNDTWWSFAGTFNGNNKKISNLYINDTSENYGVKGLFGYSLGTIKNLGVFGKIKCNSSYAGGISGSGYKIENCYFNGEIENIKSSGSYTGGVTRFYS